MNIDSLVQIINQATAQMATLEDELKPLPITVSFNFSFGSLVWNPGDKLRFSGPQYDGATLDQLTPLLIVKLNVHRTDFEAAVDTAIAKFIVDASA